MFGELLRDTALGRDDGLRGLLGLLALGRPQSTGVPKVCVYYSQSVSGLFVVKIEKTNSNSTRDFSKRITFTTVDPFVWSTLVVKARNPLRSLKKKATEDKENIILLPVDWGLSLKLKMSKIFFKGFLKLSRQKISKLESPSRWSHRRACPESREEGSETAGTWAPAHSSAEGPLTLHRTGARGSADVGNRGTAARPGAYRRHT